MGYAMHNQTYKIVSHNQIKSDSSEQKTSILSQTYFTTKCSLSLLTKQLAFDGTHGKILWTFLLIRPYANRIVEGSWWITIDCTLLPLLLSVASSICWNFLPYARVYLSLRLFESIHGYASIASSAHKQYSSCMIWLVQIDMGDLFWLCGVVFVCPCTNWNVDNGILPFKKNDFWGRNFDFLLFWFCFGWIWNITTMNPLVLYNVAFTV